MSRTYRDAKGAHGRGYTHKHEKDRKRLLARLTPGEACWWCGKPLHVDKHKNWDGKALAADHANPHGARNNEPPDRLLHFTCNSQRQDGRNDHKRPALIEPATTFRWA